MKRCRTEYGQNLYLILLCVALSLPGCDGHTGLEGKVTDGSGKAVSGATIALSTSSRTVIVRSGEDGQYRIGMMHAPQKIDLKVTATKDGFLPFEKRFSSGDHLNNLDITMHHLPRK